MKNIKLNVEGGERLGETGPERIKLSRGSHQEEGGRGRSVSRRVKARGRNMRLSKDYLQKKVQIGSHVGR